MSVIIPTRVPYPGGTRPLKAVWHVPVDDASGAKTWWEFTCSRNAEAFVSQGSSCPKHNDSMGMCPHCKGKVIPCPP